MLVCATCGSKDIWTKQWVDPNTGKLGDMTSDGEEDDNWCDNCETHVKYILTSDELRLYGTPKDASNVDTVKDWIERAEKDGTVWSVAGFAKAHKSNPEQFKDLNFKVI